MKITHISVSRKSCWEECKAKYKFHYHLEVPSPFETPEYFLYGSLIHKIFENYCLTKGESSISEIANDVLSGKISIERKGEEGKAVVLSEEYKRKLPEHLRVIKNHIAQTGTDGLLEWPFKYSLDKDKYVVGFIDRLIQRGDKFYIVDYKTTKRGFWRKNKQTIKNDLQLRTYARIVQKEFGAKPENIRCALLYLDGNELFDAKFSEESLIAAEKELLHAYNEIEKSDPNEVRGTVGDHCSRCNFRGMCPWYSLT